MDLNEEEICESEEDEEELSLEDLPPELIHLICVFIPIQHLLPVILSCKFLHSCTMTQESFFHQLCTVKNYHVRFENKPKSISNRDWFIKNYGIRILFLYTTNVPHLDEIRKEFTKNYPTLKNLDKHCVCLQHNHHRLDDVIKDVPMFDKMKEFDVVVCYGGNKIGRRGDWENDLCRLLEETDHVGVVSCMYNNAGGKDDYTFGGRWKSEGWDCVDQNNNRNSKDKKLQLIENDNWKIFHELDDYIENYNPGEVIGLGKVRDSKCNVIANWVNKELGNVEAVALAELLKYKVIHCNFSILRQNVPVLFKCIKYINMRQKEVEKVLSKIC